MAVKFSNNAATELASAITASATSISVLDGSVLPALGAGDYTYVTLDTDTNSPTREVVKVTAISGNVLTVVRGQDGTTASAFDAGVKVELRLTAALLNDVADEASATDWANVANKPDPTITLSGDVSGQGTMTDLGDVSISVTVADDSHAHTVANIDGLQAALDNKVDDSQVLTNVPANAVFTDTTYSVGDGGLTEKNFTTTLKNKLDGIAANANNYTLPFADNSANWNTAYGWGDHATEGYYVEGTVLNFANSSFYASGDNNHVHFYSPAALIPASTTTANNAALGTSVYRWDGVFSSTGNFDGVLTVKDGVTGSSSTDWQKVADLGVLDFYSHTYGGTSIHKFYNGNWTGYFYFSSGSSTGEQHNIRITSSGNTPENNKIEINDGTTWHKVWHEGTLDPSIYLTSIPDSYVLNTGDSMSGPLVFPNQDDGVQVISVSAASTPAVKTSGNFITGGSDTGGMVKLNNVAVQTWYGFSVSPTISGYTVAQGTPAFNVDARYGISHAANSFRAPVFYDVNNTNYFGNFASTSVFNILHLGGGQITASSAKLQVNGFMRTGNIILHDGGNTPNTAEQTVLSATGGELYRTSSNGGNTYKFYDTGNFNPSDYLTTAAYVDDYVNAASFNTGTGVLTLTRAEGGTVTVDLDGRYLTSESDSQTLSWNGGTGVLSISGGNTVDLDGRYYINGSSYLTLSNQELSTAPSAAYSIWLDANDTDAPARLGTYAASDPMGIYVNGDGGTGGGTLGAGAVQVYHTGHFSGTNIANWQTAYGWGDHSTQNYALTTGDTFTGDVYFNGWLYMNVAGQNLVLQSDAGQRNTLEWQQLGVRKWVLDLEGDSDLNFSPNGAYNFRVGGQRVFTDGYHPNADKWTTARTNTVTLTGDATGTGSASVDGSGNWTVSINTTVGNDSHSHSNYVLKTGDTMTGLLTVPKIHAGVASSFADGGDPDISTAQLYAVTKVVTPKLVFLNDASGDDNWIQHTDQNDAYTVNGYQAGAWFEFIGDKVTNILGSNSSGIVASGFKGRHVEANVSVNAPIFYDSDNTAYYTSQAGTSNFNTLNVGTINRNPTVTLSGDVTGSATMTNLGSINITTTVANDSHSHSNYMLKYNGGTTSDYDSLTTNGVWRNQGGANGPFGTTHATGFTALQSDANYGWQLFAVSQTQVALRYKGTTWSSWSNIFNDGYHPNADKWTTARTHTVSLTGDVTGSASQTVDGTGNRTWSIATSVAAPAAPTISSTNIVGETVEVVIGQSSTSGVDAYEVYSSVNGGSYGLIARITPESFAATMTVVDSAFYMTGVSIAYRVYAVKNGSYSSAATASKTYPTPTLDVASMTVVPSNTDYLVQYDLPDSRFVDHVEIYMDAEATQGNLSRTGATLVYSGQNAGYTYPIGAADLDKFHQFWVEVVAA